MANGKATVYGDFGWALEQTIVAYLKTVPYCIPGESNKELLANVKCLITKNRTTFREKCVKTSKVNDKVKVKDDNDHNDDDDDNDDNHRYTIVTVDHKRWLTSFLVSEFITE